MLLLLNYRKRNGHKRWRKVAESETMLISFLYRNYEHANLHVICEDVTEYFFLSF